MIICIMGKSGSGKSTIINKLSYNNMNIIKSYSTRKPRNAEDLETHIFVTEDDFDNTDKNEIMAIYESPNNYKSWVTKELFDKNKINLYAIDPIAFSDFFEKYKEMDKIYGIYFDLDETEREKRLKKRGQSYYYKDEPHLDKKNIKIDKNNFTIIDVSGNIDTVTHKVLEIIKNI